jgi:hypothetical protein
MAKKPVKKKTTKKKPSKYDEKIMVNSTFDQVLKELGKQIKKD